MVLDSKEWVLEKTADDFISEELSISKKTIKGVCKLIEQGCELAYVSRYRGDVHNGMTCPDLRVAFETHSEISDLNKKVCSALNRLLPKIEDKEEKEKVNKMLRGCQDAEEVADISKLYSTGKVTKAKVSRELGFEAIAKQILNGEYVDIEKLKTAGITSEEATEHIVISLADLINKQETTVDVVNKLTKLQEKRFKMIVVTNMTSECKKNLDEALIKHFTDYFDFRKPVQHVQDNQILALERAESKNVLSWKLEIVYDDAKYFHPCKQIRVDKRMLEIFQKAVKYTITKQFIPKIQRSTRRFLLQKAHNAAIKCFSLNVEQLFLQDGLRNCYVIALDPGYKECKAAFLKPNAESIDTGTFHYKPDRFDEKGEKILSSWSNMTNGLDLVIAIGNGSRSHNTQEIVSRMISEEKFSSKVDVSFCIVAEDGASKYSITDAAAAEYGELDAKVVSAISIGRRLIDPMGEYVKVPPSNLGKGMYQHSVSSKKLEDALERVVRERVSMRGVDVNCASENLLKQVCGLNTKTAAGIIALRKKNGCIRSRQELLQVSGLGKASFTQCAGFLTVLSEGTVADEEPPKKLKKTAKNSAKVSGDKWNPLDATIVHPDQYEIAEKILKKCGVAKTEILNLEVLTTKLKSSDEKWGAEEGEVVKLLLNKPVLVPPPPTMKSVRKLSNLTVGEKVSGVVRNITDFGVFVDIGVEKNGLAHKSTFRNRDMAIVGTSMSFQITAVDAPRGRISLAPV